MSRYLLRVNQIKCNIINSFIPICTENAFATVCEYMGIEYQYAFAYATNFQFSADFCDTGRVADGIFTSYNFIKSFEEVYHMEIIQQQFTFFKSYIKYIEQKLASNIPVIAHFDSYYIPWSTLYHVRHTSHLVIVIGLDTDAKQLTILDPIDCDNAVDITYSEFKNGSLFCLELVQPEKLCAVLHQKFIADLIASPDMLIPTEMFQNLHALATCIADIFDPYVEFEDCYNHSLILEEKLIDDIRKTMQGINMFTVWLQWFCSENKMSSLELVIEEFKSILSKWNVLLNTLYKRSLTSWETDFKYKFSQFVDDIATMHEAAYSDFINSLKSEENETPNTYVAQSFRSSIPIDLEKYYNNKGFTLANNPITKCDLTGAGEYFCIDASHSDNIFSVKDIDFKIEYNSAYDNLICNSQLIDITEATNSVGIGIICCSEWGRANDMITVNFTDNTSKRFAVYANDLPEYNTDTSCILGQTFDCNDNLIQEKAALTVNVFYFRENQISSIQLPKCPNMHVLAVSLLMK